MMKKLYKLSAAFFAFSLIVASPAAASTSHALGFTGDWDGGYDDNGDGAMPDDYWTNPSYAIAGSSSSDSGSSYSEPSYDSGSSDSGSSDSGSSYSAPSDDSGNGGDTATVPSGLASNGSTKSIEGGQTFRQINKPADGSVAIYHCGIEQYTAQLMDADGNAAAYKYASPYKDETAGKWYLNLVTEDGVDTTGYTVCTWKGSVDYLPKLGMSGVMLNQTVVVDAEATAETAE